MGIFSPVQLTTQCLMSLCSKHDYLMCLSIGTPKNNKFSICPKWKIHSFQVSQNLGRVQPHSNLLEYWYT